MRALAAALLSLCACSTTTSAPGDTIVGTFSFTVSLLQDDCGFVREADAGMVVQVDPASPFVATLSYDSKSEAAWLVSGTTTLSGSIQGDRLTVASQVDPQRGLPERKSDGGGACGCSGILHESIEATLLASSQECPSGAGADAGTSPFSSDAGVDATLLVCGYLTDRFSALDGANCDCDPCQVVYAIQGTRK